VSKKLLRLYVAGSTQKTKQVITTLNAICEVELQGQYELEVIDVIKHPQLAEDQRIIATPTLIKTLPEPMRRVIGDLMDIDSVLIGLDLKAEDNIAEFEKLGEK
tara:strand:- start:133 stop:444 length:312 start_codon:yes stop_codon:yes gene_type:complete